MSWEDWIVGNGWDEHKTIFDTLMESAVSSYELDSCTRRQDHIDRRDYLLKWWNKHREHFRTYTTFMKVAELLNMDHSSVSHYINHRKKSRLFMENTKCINDYLNS